MTADRLAAIEAAPDAEESQRVRIARALWEADHEPQHGHRRTWEEARDDEPDRYLRLADAALAVMRPDGDPAAAVAWDEGYTSGHSNAMRQMSDEPHAPKTANPYRAALAQPAPATDEAGQA